MQQISPRDLSDWLNEPGRTAPGILDVRESWEHERAMIPGSVPLPMSQLVARIAEVDPGRQWVVVCHHGMRSMQVALYLERSGHAGVFNLAGGIDAWAREVDPGMSRY